MWRILITLKKLTIILDTLQGDYVLAQVAKCFGKYLRPTDFSARYGGEEFLIFLDLTAPEVLTAAERIRKKVAELNLTSPSGIKLPALTVSLGITQLKLGEETAQFIKRADKALYQAKSEGRNRTITA